MRNLLIVFLLSIAFVSCTDDRTKAAAAYCDCFKSKAKKFSPEFKKLMAKVAKNDNPQKALTTEFKKLDEDVQLTVQEEMSSLQGIENDSKMKACEKKIAEYKIRGKDDQARYEVLLDEMRKQSGCEVLTALMAMGLQEQNKKGDSEEDVTSSDEEETPKKKKQTNSEEE